jgi:hypothetical protein
MQRRSSGCSEHPPLPRRVHGVGAQRAAVEDADVGARRRPHLRPAIQRSIHSVNLPCCVVSWMWRIETVLPRIIPGLLFDQATVLSGVALGGVKPY